MTINSMLLPINRFIVQMDSECQNIPQIKCGTLGGGPQLIECCRKRSSTELSRIPKQLMAISILIELGLASSYPIRICDSYWNFLYFDL